MKHTHHDQILGRLRRAKGHLESVINMIEDERHCLEVAQQLKAVESAVSNAKHVFIHDHIDHCVSNVSGEANAIDGLKKISKFL